jgi:protein-disulfide isomerase
MKRYLPLGVIVVVLLAAIAGGSVLLRSKQPAAEATSFGVPTTSTPVASRAPSNTVPGQNAVVAAQSPTPAAQAGATSGVSVLVEEYGDYQCPPCGQLYPELKKIESEYGKRIEFVFHNFPLVRNHKNAMAAAQAAEAARLQDHFVQMHDRIYETQDKWKDLDDPHPVFLQYARDLGLDVARFQRDSNGQEVQQRIERETQQAIALGVQGTPTILIEGQQLKADVTNAEGIRKGIDFMLARKAARP